MGGFFFLQKPQMKERERDNIAERKTMEKSNVESFGQEKKKGKNMSLQLIFPPFRPHILFPFGS